MQAAGRPYIQIAGLGHYAPERVVTNLDLEKVVDTSDEWIRTRTGIRERRIAAEGETATDMAHAAALRAMEAAEVSVEEIDLILVSTLTPDHLLPSTACELQAALGAPRSAAYDFATACSGFPYGLQIAEGHILAGHARTILLVCVEKMSAVLDWTDRTTCVLFGDGAGAAVLTAAEGGSGVLATAAGADGRFASALWRPSGGAARPFCQAVLEDHSSFVAMNGSEVFKQAVRMMGEMARRVTEDAGLGMEDVALLIPHQANQRIIDAAAKGLSFPEDRVYSNVARYGNMSSASIPVALSEAVEEGRLGRGDVAVLVAFGAGFTWGGAAIRL